MDELPAISDPARLKAVEAARLLDSAPEADFDRLAQIAARLLSAPAAFVTVIDRNRQYLKSAVSDGAVTDQAGSSTGLDRSFCKHAVASNGPFIVEDARQHPLVKDNKAVGDGVIAYAGIPFEDPDGHAIGALCVIDFKPRQWSEDDIENLRAIARAASQLLAERETGRASNQAQHARAEAHGLESSVAGYLRAEDAYARLLGTSDPLNFEAEAEARRNLVEWMEQLRRAHDAGVEGRSNDAVLLGAIGRYLEAERQREALARSFAAGGVDLEHLQAAIARQMDAADALRIGALDHGVEL
jgi:GAF domain-containing protein